MRLVFRADASRITGSGHVMRVTTIAQEAIARGFECHFVGNISDLPWVSEYINQMGFESLLEVSEKFTPDANRDVLILDSYTVAPDSKFIDASNWKMIVCVQDAFTPKYNADIYVNQSLHDRSLRAGSNVLTGPDFSLIRKEITKSSKIESPGLIPSVLVLGGGSDPFGFVDAVLSFLQQGDFGLELYVFSNDDLAKFGTLNICQYQIGPELDLVAKNADLVITTASTSSIEFIARELPTLVACAVDNQEVIYSELCELGYALPFGVRDRAGHWDLDLEILLLAIRNLQVREDLRNSVRGVIDLLGSFRVVDAIEKWTLGQN